MARLLAVTVAAFLELGQPDGSSAGLLLVALVSAHAVIRLGARSKPGLVYSDVVVASAAVVATGGASSSFALFALVAAAETGLVLGMSPGLAAGGVLALSGAVAFPTSLPFQMLSWFALLPLVATTGALARRIWGERDEQVTRAALAETHDLLERIRLTTESGRVALDSREVVASILARAGRELAAPAACLVVVVGDRFVIAGSYGLADPTVRDLDAARGQQLLRRGDVPASDLPRELAGREAVDLRWYAEPLREGVSGVLLVAATESRTRAWRRTAERIADDASLALTNARAFEAIVAAAADAQRHHIAAELHDGIAQAITHVQLELGFLARDPVPDRDAVRETLERLSGITSRTVDDIRAVVEDLRATTGSDGIAASLRDHLREFASLTGPPVTLSVRSRPTLDTDREQEVLRIAQEAIANARRHSGAGRIHVTLVGGDGLELIVEDDGSGLPDRRPLHGGHGLEIMRERADRIGGALEVRAGDHGGTRVCLTVPDPAARQPA